MKILQQFSLVLFAMVACFGAPAQTPKQGGTLNLIVQPEPPSINLGSSKLRPSAFVASQICDRIAVMHKGRVVETGTVEAIARAPKHAYTRQLFDAMPGRAWEERAERHSDRAAVDLDLVVESLA